MRGIILFGFAGILTAPLSGCVWLGSKVLGETFRAGSMTNPTTGQHITCGNYVQKGEITKEQMHELNKCVADYATKGFVLDNSPSPQPSPPQGERE